MGYAPIIGGPNLEPLFGEMSRETAAAVLAELGKADAAIVRIAHAFGPTEQHHHENVDTKNRLGLETTYAPMIDGCLSSYSEIDDEDGTTSGGATDFLFSIDCDAVASREPRTWDVTTTVTVNCDRRHCADDPHELLRLVGEATSPIDAAGLLTSQIEDLHRWLTNHEDDRWRVFRHANE
ncbi:MAG: hypothetical protein M3Q30_12300 [Actinomycetota bacterium]|nr:hypothetical protein [Actinomycetota bacterium]